MKREGQIRISSGYAITAAISKEGNRMSGEVIIDPMKPTHERSSGLGGGFTGCGIYPQYKDFHAFHVFYDCETTRRKCESFLREHFEAIHSELIPICEIPTITDKPIIWWCFVDPLKFVITTVQLDEKEFIVKAVMKTNAGMPGAHVSSSGKSMGTFKIVDLSEDVGVLYKLEEYEGYSWITHKRYPINAPGWWGGVYPFTLFDYSTVHNSKVSSYDANRRSIEMFGYKCTLQTDIEVIIHMMDYLPHVQELTLEEVVNVIVAPLWSTIFTESNLELRDKLEYLRTIFSSLLVMGPFSIVFDFDEGLMALNDRPKLCLMAIGEKDDKVLTASEEAAIRMMEPHTGSIWAPDGGEPVITKVKEGVNEWA